MADSDNSKRKASVEGNIGEPAEKRQRKVSVGDHASIKATNCAGPVLQENGHACKVAGRWYHIDEVEIAPPKRPDEEKKLDPLTVWVGNISHSVDEEQLELDFGQHGEIARVNFFGWKGFAFITYMTEEDAQKALTMDADEYWGRALQVKLAAGRSDKESGGVGHEIFVKGLPSSTSEDSVTEYFSKCGSISKVKVPASEDGKPKGIAFVTFDSEEALEKALDLDGQKFSESTITVEAASKSHANGKGKSKGKDKGKSKGKGKGKGKSKGKKGSR